LQTERAELRGSVLDCTPGKTHPDCRYSTNGENPRGLGASLFSSLL
jgi:hypothetical protein